MANCIIIGASHAAAQTCVSLRQGGWSGGITLIGDENALPYHRPPLSKDFLSGVKTLDDILIRPASAYKTADITLRLGERVESFDPVAKTIRTDKPEIITYDKLVIATGARVRQLPVPGADLAGVYYLRDKSDVLAIKTRVKTGKRALIIGGGYIGLETAASLKKQGVNVTLLEAMPRILQRVTAPELSRFYKRVFSEEGVEIWDGVTASHIERTNEDLVVKTSGGRDFKADFVIVGIGVIPNMELAKEAGLTTKNGIEVNAFCQTSDPDVYACGDVTWHFSPLYDRYIRLESVPNATEQAKTIALHLNGNPKPYNSLPWFWSDQFDLKLQIAGLSEGYDDIVIRGDIENSRSFSAFYYKGDRLLAVDAVNAPREFMMAKMALIKGKTLDKVIIADPAQDLKSAIC